ncbi:MAG TPA: trehalose-6-phosphate synthase [Candidatus Saccharimonadaceae bacterium]|nr:trehalose-6-phosphate synthase [Candidatus Saccharimonadaceae bacterium]
MIDARGLRTALAKAANGLATATEPERYTTRDNLVAWARAHVRDRRLVVVSNREPYSHVRGDGEIKWVRNAGGLTVALDAVARALDGLWIAHGSGDADVEASDARGRVRCPPDQPEYTLRRVWLTASDHEHYYSGLSNGALWPLCHIAYVRPRFRIRDWQSYRAVNRRFAKAVLEELGDAPGLVFLQDYHLALAARFLREARPDLQILHFWHIPWPNPEVFRILPWKEELLDGMLASDLVGFHIRAHAENFIESVATTLEVRAERDHQALARGGRRTWVRHFPISVAADEIGALAGQPATTAAERALRERLGLGDCRVGLGVDRLDYTKGIPERLEGIERLFERHPEWIGRFAFVQIGVPSRVELSEYRAVLRRVKECVARINRRFPRAGGQTVQFIETGLDFRELIPYYRLADVCAVTSLHDGMNLVAKEYVAARPDGEGALVLSPFTGAARELERAHIASPYDREAMAEAFHAALTETDESRRARMAALREAVRRRNIYDWAIEVLDTFERLSLRTPTEDARLP